MGLPPPALLLPSGLRPRILGRALPLLTAVLGVGITMAGIVALASVFSINTSTPSLAMMIGLADTFGRVMVPEFSSMVVYALMNAVLL